MYQDRMMMNTMCRWLCSMCYLTCSPINLNSELPEAWLKIGCVKVLIQLPPGTESAGSILMHPGSSSEISLRKVTRKITNNTLYLMHSASPVHGYFIPSASKKLHYPNEYGWLLRIAMVNQDYRARKASLFMLY